VIVSQKEFRKEGFMSKVWLVTGSANGLGRDIAEAVLTSDFRRSLIFELKSTECELSLADTVKQFDSRKGDGSGVEVLETEHGTSSGFDAAMVLFNQNALP
jgi:NAD(P)-dependent dehydrogenase (short-subunit alcohol dehydrogenase family)